MKQGKAKDEVYISVDIEASGPIPGEYSMLSLGACVVGDTSETFYREFKPISGKHVQEAVEVSGLSLEKLRSSGIEPELGIKEFDNWIKEVSGEKRPVFTAFNATFDWMFIAYYFHRFLGRNPFGISGLDIKAYSMGMLGTSWGETVKRKLDKRFLSGRRHTHHALNDAVEQAEIFSRMLEYRKKDD